MNTMTILSLIEKTTRLSVLIVAEHITHMKPIEFEDGSEIFVTGNSKPILVSENLNEILKLIPIKS